jgi:hypothetical protein
VVSNTLFRGRDADPAFERLVAGCGEPALELDPYVVWECAAADL